VFPKIFSRSAKRLRSWCSLVGASWSSITNKSARGGAALSCPRSSQGRRLNPLHGTEAPGGIAMGCGANVKSTGSDDLDALSFGRPSRLLPPPLAFAARIFSAEQDAAAAAMSSLRRQNPRQEPSAGRHPCGGGKRLPCATINGDRLVAVVGPEWVPLRLSNPPFSNAPMLCHDGSSLGSNSRGSNVSNRIGQPPIPNGDSQ
jgi:hypothetical protein